MTVLDKFRLDGKVVLVTGAAGLLGRGYCRAIAEAGGTPVAGDLDLRAAEHTAALAGDRALGVQLDVSDRDSVKACFAVIQDRCGGLDGLVNNAAYNAPAQVDSPNFVEFEDFPAEVWQRSLDVDLSGAFFCTQEAGRLLRSRGGGVVVNISSTYGNVAPDQRLYESLRDPRRPGQRFVKPICYSTTKGALLSFTRYLSTYWAEAGIRVNSLTLGGVFDDQEPGFVARYEARTPLGRMAQVGEYEAALVFLLSDASSYMTGSNLVVDGGWTAW